MNKKLIVFTAAAVLINILILALFGMGPLKVAASCLVILLSGLSLYFLLTRQLKDAFRYGIGMLLPFFGIVEYVLSLVMPATFSGNWGLAIVVLLLLLQSLLIFVARYVSAWIR